MIYATTPEFLETFGLKDLDSLPDLKEFQEIARTVEQTETGPVESVEIHPEDAAKAESADFADSGDSESPSDISTEKPDESK
ncbi:MAG: hypothetical protein ACLQDV_00195 [Candidatus Binataceae bacterium]